ncbi:phage protease [Methylophilus sp. DW102]|uniref:phage protease n=1 Tax=Methylophilus sp. DW102 TaxID=3095607 RepID=UPI00308FCE7A|nr:phage protease [Methylophilus sp. DW102]
MERNLGLGILTFDVATNATDMQILPAQDFRADDGRPEDVDSWKINSAIAQKLIAKLAARKNDLLIDYEHQSLRAALNGQPVIAAGWFKQMEWREGSGMWLKQVDLTNRAKGMISNKEVRYTSPVFVYDKNTGEILEIVSVALTNTPAVDGMQDIAALTANYLNNINPLGDTHMDQNKEVAALSTQVTSLTAQVAALTTERDQANNKVTALTAERDALQTKVADIEAKAKAEAEAAEKKQHDDLLQTALSDGRLTPKQKPWAEGLTLAALNSYLETAPVIIGDKLQHDTKHEGGEQLTAEELAMCTSMQIDPKEFLANKTAN